MILQFIDISLQYLDPVEPTHIYIYIYIYIHVYIYRVAQKKTIQKLNQIDIDTNGIFRTNFNAY